MKMVQKIMSNEEAFHLLLAAVIGVIGGLVNLFFFEFCFINSVVNFPKYR